MTRNEIQNTLSDFCKMLSICQLCPTIFHLISYSLFLTKNTVMTNSISQRKFHDFPKKYDQYVPAKPLYFALGGNNIVSDDDGDFICRC